MCGIDVWMTGIDDWMSGIGVWMCGIDVRLCGEVFNLYLCMSVVKVDRRDRILGIFVL